MAKRSRIALSTASRTALLAHLNRQPVAVYLRTRRVTLADLRDFISGAGAPYVVMPAPFGFRLVRRVAR